MRAVVTTSLMIVLLGLVACGSREEQADRLPARSDTQTGTQQQPAHASAGVEPGSYEDWCGEHAVPESLCTRCNPTLIAAFKATGDWCEEHALPESQCLVCNPGLVIERPPRPSGDQP